MKLQENLKAFVDGETRPEETALIRKELEEHPEMQVELDDLNRLSASIREYVTQPEPVGLAETLTALEAAKPKAQKKRLALHQLRWIGGFATAVVLVGLAGSILSHSASANEDASSATLPPQQTLRRLRATRLSPNTTQMPTGQKTWPKQMRRRRQALQQLPLGGVNLGPGAVDADNRVGSKVIGGEDATGFNSETLPGNRALAAQSPRDGVTGTVTRGTAGSAYGLRVEGRERAGNSGAPSTHAKAIANRGTIIKTAALGIKVKNVAESQQSVEGIANGNGGYVQNSARTDSVGTNAEADITVRVPVQCFDIVIKAIRGLGDVISDSSSGNDVTSDIVDMDARMKVLRAEESDYMVLLGRARSTAQIIEIKDKLTEIREEIESIDGQRKSTKDLANYSTINVHLAAKGEPEKPKADKDKEKDKGWLDSTWSTAVGGLGSAAKVIAQLFIFVLVWAPIWIPAALLSSYLYRKNKW